jgi:hypothetical protein
MADENLTPERAIRLLHAKAAELEDVSNMLLRDDGDALDLRAMQDEIGYRTADIALAFTLLADHIERSLPSPEVQKEFLKGFGEGRPDDHPG